MAQARWKGGHVSRFDRYLLSQLMMLFGFFALVLVSVYWVNRAVLLFDQLISDGQSAWVFLQFTALTLPTVIRLVLPVSAFVAAAYVTNRLLNESELVVMQSTGFSPARLARPVLYFGVIVATMVAVLVHVLEPISRAELADRRDEIAANITSRLLTEGAFLHPAKGVTFYIRDITPQGELRDVFLADARSRTARTIYTAERALLVRSETGPKLVMFEGLAQTLRVRDMRLSTTRFADFSYDIGALIDSQGQRGKTIEEFSTRALLRADPAAIASIGSSRAAFLYEANDRLTQPLLSVVGALIGFSALLLGGFSRFGVWKQIGIATVMLILVQFLANLAADTAIRDAGAWPVMYVPAAVGFALVGGMLWLAGRSRRVRRTGTGGAAT
jgi:lipopolysaccharide export system permease protein